MVRYESLGGISHEYVQIRARPSAKVKTEEVEAMGERWQKYPVHPGSVKFFPTVVFVLGD